MDEQIENQQEPKKSSASFYRLCAALLILGTALILRAFFPEQTRGVLQDTVSGGWDYTAILGDVGDSLRSFVLGVPHPDEVEIAVEAETYDPEHEPPPFGDDEDASGMGGFDLPILWLDASYFTSDFGEDDTFPLPFGMQKPERVDYTAYELPFETTPPAAGRLSSPFGYRIHPVYGDWRFHYGVDIANRAGTPISAFADGTVTATGRSSGYGNYVILEHEGGFYTLYAHCRTVGVKAGQTVGRGEEIATIGSTGVTTGPHLHFEIRYGDAFLDPAGYLDV
jgi:murein DD-endopeptidase MepM/ murein hydrolase activator NlpD